MRSSSLTTAIPYLKQFDPYDTYHIEYLIGLHRKEQDEFEEIATTYFPGTAYGDIVFQPIPLAEILNELMDPATGDYKRTSDYIVQLSDPDKSDNADIAFRVLPRLAAKLSPNFSYYSLALFISIMQFYRTAGPGDQITSDLLFSWGKRKTESGKYVNTIVFHFDTSSKGERFFDYSSEDPTIVYYKLKLMKELDLMND